MVYLQRNKTSVIGKGVVVCLELIKFHKTTTPTTRTNKPECERKENKRKEEKRREEKRREEKRREEKRREEKRREEKRREEKRREEKRREEKKKLPWLKYFRLCLADCPKWPASTSQPSCGKNIWNDSSYIPATPQWRRSKGNGLISDANK